MFFKSGAGVKCGWDGSDTAEMIASVTASLKRMEVTKIEFKLLALKFHDKYKQSSKSDIAGNAVKIKKACANKADWEKDIAHLVTKRFAC